jgi:predicted nucleic acid-binding protein
MVEEYLLDTNVVIEFFGGRLSPQAHTFIGTAYTSLSVITHIELFSKNEIPQEEKDLLTTYITAANIYNQINTAIVTCAIKIRKEYKIKVPDAIIAATAMSNDMYLISSNKKDFAKINGLKFIDPNDIGVL